MLPQTATLSADQGDGGDGAAAEQPQQKVGGTMKFAYKSGSRPLDGYTIKRGVGSGGFGEVYFALTDAGKEVALKQIQRNLDIEVRGVSQCLNLKHVNLISLYDLKYDEDGQAWVVMEFVTGESLKDVIERNPHGLPREEAEHWFRSIADGVIHLHDRGIVHRDLKPGNIFDDDGIVKIGDYGLSKFISASRRSGQTESVGTFQYMAPEIGKGIYGKGIDIYALGIILYEVLTGEVPFDGESSQEIIMKHLTDDPDLSGVPQPYRDVIQRALRKDPEKRFTHVGDMLAALDGKAPPESEPMMVMESRIEKEEPIYIGDEDEENEMMFGPVKHHEIVDAEVVPPARPAKAAPPRPNTSTRCSANPRPVRPGLAQTARRWRHSGLSTPAKVCILLAVVLLLTFNPAMIPFAAVIGGVYVLYLGVRGLIWCCSGGSAKSVACVEAGPVSDAVVRETIRKRPVSERVGELSGSMLLAAVITAVLVLVFMVIHGEALDGSIEGWLLYSWLTLSSIAGSWILLTLGKFWEGNDGDHFRRRFVMLLAGLAIGGAAFGTSQVLLVGPLDQDQWTAHAFEGNQMMNTWYTSEGSPLWPAYLVYFGGLFVILRWWRQTDPLRRARLSLCATAMCVLWAWIVHMFCPFPQPWGFMLAAAIAVGVQMSSPWISPRQRVAITQPAREA